MGAMGGGPVMGVMMQRGARTYGITTRAIHWRAKRSMAELRGDDGVVVHPEQPAGAARSLNR